MDEDRMERIEILLERLKDHRLGKAEYLLSADDARWLSAIGISPTRHRSHPARSLPPLGRPLPAARDES